MIHAHITTAAPFFFSGDRTRRKRRRRLVIVIDPARGCTCITEVNNKEHKINVITVQRKCWRSTVKTAINFPKRCVINHDDDDMNGDENEWLLREKKDCTQFLKPREKPTLKLLYYIINSTWRTTKPVIVSHLMSGLYIQDDGQPGVFPHNQRDLTIKRRGTLHTLFIGIRINTLRHHSSSQYNNDDANNNIPNRCSCI